jgi:hypothetical protein
MILLVFRIPVAGTCLIYYQTPLLLFFKPLAAVGLAVFLLTYSSSGILTFWCHKPSQFLEPGIYEVRVWYRYGGGADLALLSVVSPWFGMNYSPVVSPDDGTWLHAVTHLEIRYPDTFRLGFELKANGRYTYLEIDDVEFVRTGPPYPTPTPTPTAGTRSLTVKTKHLPGDQVPIKAPRKLNGLVFDRWVGDTGALEGFISPNTTVTIPSTLDVQVEATYKRP